jgi:hypothetical protein
MAPGRTRETRIVLLSPTLMKLYEVQGVKDAQRFQPITFYDPQECLEMLTDPMEEAGEVIEEPPKSMKVEKQWGELELRLSFFSDIYKWQ